MTTALRSALACLSRGENLTADEARDAVLEIADGRGTDVLIAALLTGLRVKGEVAEELTGVAQAARSRMTPFERGPGLADRLLLDTCGTGGDDAGTVNISTATAILASACGVTVAKHGNRSASSRTGSSDVLQVLGVEPDVEPDVARACLERVGIAFFFAPRYHSGFRHAASIRRELPFRTLFNLVGPLVNPASPEYQLLGVPEESQAELIASTLLTLGTTQRAVVVTGSDGLDEITLDGPTWVRWIEDGEIQLATWLPDDFGLEPVPSRELRAEDAAASAGRILAVLEGRADPARDVFLANTAAALRVAGRAETLKDGVAMAKQAIASGAARERLSAWGAITRAPRPTPDGPVT